MGVFDVIPTVLGMIKELCYIEVENARCFLRASCKSTQNKKTAIKVYRFNHNKCGFNRIFSIPPFFGFLSDWFPRRHFLGTFAQIHKGA